MGLRTFPGCKVWAFPPPEMAQDVIAAAEGWEADDVVAVVPNVAVVGDGWVTCEVYGADARVFRRPIAGRH
eukprot:2221655-Rhodomonas_salina.1